MVRISIRLLAALAILLGANYIVWRWAASLNWDAWWIAVPLVAAETYSLIDVVLMALTAWRIRPRGPAPDPPADLTVDVLITTFDEPADLVLATARAARGIRYPHATWILDDGNRAEIRRLAEAEGIGYLTRGPDWENRPRHAKAGNLNNALMSTTGEFLLILDADQVPHPDILDKTLGWFNDRKVALVQTPQWFHNVPADDPLGSQAPLFYGPIQQGKDGWNAAYFCGSNALLRREALMQLGLAGYVQEIERGVRRALSGSRSVLRRARRSPEAARPEVAALLGNVDGVLEAAARDLAAGAALGEVTYRVRRETDDAVRQLVSSDLQGLRSDLADIADLGLPDDGSLPDLDELTRAVDRLTVRDLSPMGALESVQRLLDAVSVERAAEAQPIMPLATISVTEDLATSMRLHGRGFTSVYHHEILAEGLAPEDLQTMLTQRLRWAQGTMQVFLRENPLVQRRLRWGQRLMYLATMWSYLSGFAAVVYIAAPIIYLTTGVLPVSADAAEFAWRFAAFMLASQLLFALASRGIGTWRGQQYNLAMFPLWIRACVTAARNVWFGRPLDFAVTRKEGPVDGPRWALVRVQLAAMTLLAAAAVVGLVRLGLGEADPLGTAVNLAWVVLDLAVLGVVIKAARYRGYAPLEPTERRTDAVHP